MARTPQLAWSQPPPVPMFQTGGGSDSNRRLELYKENFAQWCSDKQPQLIFPSTRRLSLQIFCFKNHKTHSFILLSHSSQQPTRITRTAPRTFTQHPQSCHFGRFPFSQQFNEKKTKTKLTMSLIIIPSKTQISFKDKN